jgi:hypothetical protein
MLETWRRASGERGAGLHPHKHLQARASAIPARRHGSAPGGDGGYSRTGRLGLAGASAHLSSRLPLLPRLVEACTNGKMFLLPT